jgi:hypothetical protein
MSETKHTPGPWRIENDGDDIFVIGRPEWKCTRFGIEGDWDVATITEMHEDNKPETIANAHLIAAAPELYDALKYVIGIFEHYADTPEEINAIGLALNVLGTAEGDEGGAA